LSKLIADPTIQGKVKAAGSIRVIVENGQIQISVADRTTDRIGS